MDETRQGWECGIYTKKQIEWLQKTIEELQSDNDHKQALLDALKTKKVESESRTEGVGARMNARETHQSMIDNMAHHLSEMSPEDRQEVIGKAQAWAANCVYAPIDPAERLAREVAKLDGYGLGRFLQDLMKFGEERQKARLGGFED